MKKVKIIYVLAAGILCLALLAGCSKTSGSDTPSSTPSENASGSGTEESSSNTDAPSSENADWVKNLNAALNSCSDFELDSAGGSLKAWIAASDLVIFSAENVNVDNLKNANDEIQKWYEGLDSSKKDMLKANWSTIYENAKKLVAAPGDVKEQLTEAGIDIDFSSIDLESGMTVADGVKRLLSV